MLFVLATHNRGKLTEMQALLQGHELKSLSDLGVTNVPDETGDTFEENARIKAMAACQATGLPCIADDSGLCVDALEGAPGVYSARFGGAEARNDAERCAYLLAKMAGKTNRDAHFESTIVCVFPNHRELIACGRCDGRIIETPRGTQGFGYDPIFEIPTLGKTLAELSSDSKNELSHRGQAIRNFVLQLSTMEEGT